MKRFLHMQKGVFALLLVLFLGSETAYAYDFYKNCSTGQRLYYNIIDETHHFVEITYPGPAGNAWQGYTKPVGNITLPVTVTNGGVTYTVKRIGGNAFEGCNGLTGSLIIPNSVTEIEVSAFADCSGFTGSLTLPNSITYISEDTFYGCGFTGSLTIPSTVTSILDRAFENCSGFTGTLTLPSSLTYLGWEAFKGCTGFTGSLTIPNSVIAIDDYAFQNCSGFSGTLTIGTGVTSIGISAFNNCSNFTQVIYNAVNCANINSTARPFAGCGGTLTIGNSVQKIPNYMFFGCSGFTGSLTIPNSVTTIGTAAFRNCRGFNGSLTIGSSVNTIGTDAFCNCDGFTGNITIPNSVTTINGYAFYYCTGFTGTLTIPSSVTSIGTGAFSHCTNITQVNYNATNCADVTSSAKPFESCGGSLTIGNDVQRIPSYMFNEATSFTGTLTIGTGVTSIGTSAFKNCTGFSYVNFNAINCGDAAYLSHPFENCGGHLYIGSYVTRIPESMFSYADFTGSLSIPSSVTSIGYEAFYSCFHFSGSLSLGSSLTTIGVYAFYQCPGFTGTLTIPNSVTTLDTYAFALCSGFTSLTIGSNVNTINYGAFYDCLGLTSMTVRPETPPALDNNVFYEVSKDIPVYVPCSSLEDYQSATGWSDFTNIQCEPMVIVTAVPTSGGTVSGGGTYSSGTSVTVTAYPNSNYVFMSWSKDGTVVSCNSSYTFTVSGDTELEATFVYRSYLGDIIGEATTSNLNLPSNSFYNYSLTEQIYTASEIGGSTTINTISFFNEGSTKTRTFDIYMKHTTETGFSSTTDWISATSSNKVFSGSVTMRSGTWTTIVLDTPFAYNGSSNLVLIVDDNTDNWSSGMKCRTYATSSSQAIYIYSDYIDYNPSSPSSYGGSLIAEKNQIMFNRTAYNIAATSSNTTAGTVSGGGVYGKGDLCKLQATAGLGYTFVSWVDESGVVVSTDANYSFVVMENKTLVANFMSGTDVCSLTFDLYDSYGDGWNGNYLMVDCENGMSVILAIIDGETATYTLPIENGSYVELSWIEGSWTQECSFIVSYEDGEVMIMGSNLGEDYEYGFYMDCSGQPTDVTYLGDHSGANNFYLPSFSYYNYSLSEQIYTADEIGTAGLINSIAFYNDGTETKTRYYDIYLATTDKTTFESQTDWISLTDAQLVFDGSVTMYAGKWTSIVFNYQFEYDGNSNLVLIVDDNTGGYTGSPHMSCLVYAADGLQSLRIYDDYSDFDPANPYSYNGTLMNVKNQILLGIGNTGMIQTVALAAGQNWFSTYVDITLADLQTALTDVLGTASNVSITIQSQTQSCTLRRGSWTGQLTSLDVSQMYKISVSADCEIMLEGMPVNPAEHPVTIHYGDNWIAYPFAENMTLTEAFAGFAANNDQVSSQTASSKYQRNKWNGQLNTLQPGQGYIYNSSVQGTRTFTFPSGAK